MVYRGRRNHILVMGDDLLFVIASVQARLKDLDLQPCYLGSTETAKELLRLATEHRATDHLDTSSLASPPCLK